MYLQETSLLRITSDIACKQQTHEEVERILLKNSSYEKTYLFIMHKKPRMMKMRRMVVIQMSVKFGFLRKI